MHSSSSTQADPSSENVSLRSIFEAMLMKLQKAAPDLFSSNIYRFNDPSRNSTFASLPFEPTLQTTIKVGKKIGFNYGANIYDENHNMIIACPSNSYIYFLDATDLTPHSMRENRKIDSSVVQMSYDAETGTYILGCAFGEIYSYNAPTDTLTKVLKQGEDFILAISHIDPYTFAFSSSTTKQLYFKSVNANEAVAYYSKDSVAWYLLHLKEQGRLLAGLSNGQIAIYSTNKGDKYPMVASIQAHKFGKYVACIISVSIKGHEYIISTGNDKTIKIWKFIKGNLRVLKIINNTEDTSTMVYLEKYQVIATTHHRDFVKIFQIPTGKLQATLYLKESAKTRNIFLIKDKNAIGIADVNKNIIEIVQFHPAAKETTMFMLDKLCIRANMMKIGEK